MFPDRVSVPVPVLVRASRPAPSEATPEKLVDAFVPPLERVAVATPLLVTLPAPASDPTVSPKPPMSNTAPDATVSALLAPIALPTPTLRVPALTFVAPVYVLATVTLNVPLRVWVTPPVPEIAPAALGDVPRSVNREHEAGRCHRRRNRQRAGGRGHRRCRTQGDGTRPGVVVGEVSQDPSTARAGSVETSPVRRSTRPLPSTLIAAPAVTEVVPACRAERRACLGVRSVPAVTLVAPV